MNVTNPCYNPNVFSPDKKSLLSKGDWSMVQVYLNDAANLPLVVGHTPPEQFPFKDSVDIFKTINSGARTFQTVTLPKANLLGNALYNIGTTASASFQAVINLMAQENPSKDALQELFGNLADVADGAKLKAKTVFTETKTFVDMLGAQGPSLAEVVNNEISKQGGLQSQIKKLKGDITIQQKSIQQAQTVITSDKKVIHDVVYYSWIPLIGTIVAVAEVISHDNDIKKQLAIVNAAKAKIQTDNTQINDLQGQMAQLVYAENFNNNQITLLNKVLPDLESIQSAWSRIAAEAGDVLDNINAAEGNALKGIKCLAEVQLEAAVNEWETIANDGHDFMRNFYVKPVAQ